MFTNVNFTLFTFVNLKIEYILISQTHIKEDRISGRYITLDHILPILKSYSDIFDISVIGSSEMGVDIPMVTLGSGPEKVLAWSQMHGNESTTTKAVMDLLAFVAQKEDYQNEVTDFLSKFTLYIIPILSPDGAAAYTRVNANGVDLNRDAQQLSQKESKALRAVFNKVKPDLCLNLHDQRTIYGISSRKTATVSFLAPAADKERTVNNTRTIAMKHISRMYDALEEEIPGQIGRYDDGFNINCVGDTFTNLGVPTILFEAGHFSKDYQREITRGLIFKALLVLFNISERKTKTPNSSYQSIPENDKSFCDIVLRDVLLENSSKTQNIAIQYIEVLKNEKIEFVPTILELDSKLKGHREISCEGDVIVFNNTKNLSFNENIKKAYNKTKEIELTLRIS